VTLETAEVPISNCAGCGKPNDMATATVAGHRPSPGDISICFYCGHISAFDDDLRLRPLTDAEMREVAGNEKLLRVQRARAMAMEKMKPQ